MNFYYDRTDIATTDNALSKYAADEFESSHRSTVPLLSWLKHEQPAVSSLLRDMGMPTGYNLHLEYKVKPPKCRGQASHTDLMVMSGESALAIEAKWTEPRYDTVDKWLKKGTKPHNRQDVLTGWLSLLQEHAMRELHIEDFSETVYQMVHRAASACKAGKMPRLAYLVFTPSRDKKTAAISKLLNDLTHLWNLLGNPERFPFYLVEVPLSSTPAFEKIAPLPKGHKETVPPVKAALSGSARLFKFESYLLTRVGENVTRSTGYSEDPLVGQPGIAVPDAGQV
jgi:hypothetical protein